MELTQLQILKSASLQEKADATRRLEAFKGFFRHLSGKGVPAPAPSTYEFLTDEDLRKFAERESDPPQS